MSRTSHRVWAALGVATLATVGLLSTAAASSASSAVPTEHIIGLSNNPKTNGVGVVIANGPVHAKGRDVVINNHRDNFVFPNGALKVYHWNTTRAVQHFDKVTCYGTFGQSGKYKIIGGTGAYAGAHGHGAFSIRGTEVGCSHNKPPKIFQLQLKATGPLSL